MIGLFQTMELGPIWLFGFGIFQVLVLTLSSRGVGNRRITAGAKTRRYVSSSSPNDRCNDVSVSIAL